MKTIAIVPAAGAGKRFNNNPDIKKQFIQLKGIPVLARALINLSKAQAIDEIIVVAPPGDVDYTRVEIVEKYEVLKVSEIVGGGVTRQESILNGLKHVSKNTDLLLVHDGVRPFVTLKMIDDVTKAARESGAAITAIRASDTVKTVEGGYVQGTVAREAIALAQTPQCFRYALLKEAIKKADAEKFIGTDEASLVERLGIKVVVVDGSTTNIKITSKEDLSLAEAILALADEER